MFNKTIILALTCASLTLGCTQAEYYQGAIHQAAKQAKDLEAETLAAAPCLIGLGAYFRISDANVKRGLVMLCGNGQDMPDLFPGGTPE